MNVLLIEDNEGDHIILQEAFSEAEVPCRLSIIKDGAEAINFINGRNDFKNSPRPHLILLDLNLPLKNGKEVLKEIRKNHFLEHVPVLILSNSNSMKDICECYALGVNAYIGKPSQFKDFVSLAQNIKDFWLGLVQQCAHRRI